MLSQTLFLITVQRFTAMRARWPRHGGGQTAARGPSQTQRPRWRGIKVARSSGTLSLDRIRHWQRGVGAAGRSGWLAVGRLARVDEPMPKTSDLADDRSP